MVSANGVFQCVGVGQSCLVDDISAAVFLDDRRVAGVILSGDKLLLLPDGEEPPPSGRIRYRLVLLRSHQTKELLKSGS